ncbi:MAG: 3-dehydroquinate synthase [Planctomycetes bacterium]|nr:3-dehydroquinate synthase [Planctomycetota bacterium]
MSHDHTVDNAEPYIQQFSVPFRYPVYFTQGLFDPDNPILENVVATSGTAKPHRVLVYIDEGVIEAVSGVERRITDYLAQRPERFTLVRPPESVPGGERTKNGWNVVQNIMSVIGSSHLCRHSFVIAVGGGSALDMLGFAASLVHRGVRLIRIPTTVLAQNDAGVGVKNGMDEHGMKNFVGTFAPPYAVLNDSDFLTTLDDKYWLGGLSEAYKVAIIKDRSLLDFLAENAKALRNRDMAPMEHVIRCAAILHLEHIAGNGDPFEFGTARPLDFGHWCAHRLEVQSNYAIGHGQAVAIGIALDTYYAWRTGLVTQDERDLILTAMRDTGLPIWSQVLEHQDENGELEFLRGLKEFQEHLGGRLTITLPNHLGEKIEIHEMDSTIIQDAVVYLKDDIKKDNG